MNNKRKRLDNFSIGFRVSEACTRSALAVLIFAAIGFGLAEKLRNLSQYISYGNYILARELLDVGLEDLRADPCWKAYAAETKDESDQITLIQLLGKI